MATKIRNTNGFIEIRLSEAEQNKLWAELNQPLDGDFEYQLSNRKRVIITEICDKSVGDKYETVYRANGKTITVKGIWRNFEQKQRQAFDKAFGV